MITMQDIFFLSTGPTLLLPVGSGLLARLVPSCGAAGVATGDGRRETKPEPAKVVQDHKAVLRYAPFLSQSAIPGGSLRQATGLSFLTKSIGGKPDDFPREQIEYNPVILNLISTALARPQWYLATGQCFGKALDEILETSRPGPTVTPPRRLVLGPKENPWNPIRNQRI